ncbi:MAG: glycoside hydrolase family 3 protein [Ruminococcaceae bacterium]|nr:glycoside hydrolase family 3 protein [Oscillospiraceae bacterium]
MKKLFVILIPLLLLAACSREDEPAPTPTPTAASATLPLSAESTLTGRVYELTDDSLVLQSDGGGLYAFAVEGTPELVPGQRLTLRCAGALDERSLWQSAAILELRAEPAETPAESAVYTLRGIVQDATAYTLTVLGEDGHLYSFPKDPARCFAPDGILLGYKAEVDCAEPPDPAEVWQMVTVLAMRVTAAEHAPAVPDHEAAMVRAAELLAGLSLEERAAQVFLGRLPLQGSIGRVPGGYVLYAENVAGKTPAVLKAELEALQAAAKLPLLFTVDEEGGTVNRLSAYTAFRAAPFPSPMSLYHEGGWLSVNTDTLEKCSLLRSVGIHVNLAPVADVCSPGTYMYSRSFGGDVALTEQYVDEVVRGYKSAGVGCVLKHFPGYGDNVDTHTGPARDERSLEELTERDLRPFAAGIAAGADCVLLSHNVVTALDPTLPASLSPAVYGYLRDNMGFAGVAMTDDLGMGGVRAFGDSGEAAVQALRAGCDLICSASFEREIAAVIAAVQQGSLSEARLNEAAQRVLCWKVKLGLLA